MYSIAIQRVFSAGHFLIEGDWGPENQPHTHRYLVEVMVSGLQLDRHGFLIDIVDLELRLEQILSGYRDRHLNELSAFAGLNPSLEHFARIIAGDLRKQGFPPNVTSMVVKIWENEMAWASFSEEFS